MQTVYKALLTAFFIFCSTLIFAQDNAGTLLNEGTALQKAGKHADAAAKFKEALQTDPGNAAANYQLAFSLVALKQGSEAIPYADKATKTQSVYTASAFSLLGGIYDAAGDATKAIAVYSEGLKAFPTDQNMWFNIGLAYFRNKQYAEAEKAATQAIQLDVKHANSQRLYALVAFHQNKRMNALLGLCSFLLADPNSPRAEEAYTNIQSILKGGVLKGADTKDQSPAEAKETAALNAGIVAAITAADAKKLTGTAQLEYQLKSVFMFAGQMVAKKPVKSFLDNFYTAYFYKLALSGHTEALAQLIYKNADNSAYEQWRETNPAKVAAFEKWLSDSPRVL